MENVQILRSRAQRIENFQIANLMNPGMSVDSYRRLQAIKENISIRADFFESQIPRKKAKRSLKPLILLIFPSAYYIIGR